jgi:hypothetical protein
MALGLTQPLTEWVPGIFLGGKVRAAHKADNFTAIGEPIVYKIWDPQHLTTLLASMVCYKDSFYGGDYEVCSLLECNALYSFECQPAFRRNK